MCVWFVVCVYMPVCNIYIYDTVSGLVDISKKRYCEPSKHNH